MKKCMAKMNCPMMDCESMDPKMMFKMMMKCCPEVICKMMKKCNNKISCPMRMNSDNMVCMPTSWGNEKPKWWECQDENTPMTCYPMMNKMMKNKYCPMKNSMMCCPMKKDMMCCPMKNTMKCNQEKSMCCDKKNEKNVEMWKRFNELLKNDAKLRSDDKLLYALLQRGNANERMHV